MHQLRLMGFTGLLATLLTGCGTAPMASSVAIPYPAAPQWLSLWVPQTHQYLWVTPTTTPVLLVTRQDIAAGRLLRTRLEHLQTGQSIGIIVTNPPPPTAKTSPAMKPWMALGLPVGYLVGPVPSGSGTVSWLHAGAHHDVVMTPGVPSLTALAQTLHARILSKTAATPPAHPAGSSPHSPVSKEAAR